MAKMLTHNFFTPEPVAPPKKPPRPGAPANLTNLPSLCPVESYNDGVKVHMNTQIPARTWGLKMIKIRNQVLFLYVSLKSVFYCGNLHALAYT